MNIYKVLIFDGCCTREFHVHGYDLMSAIQSNVMIIQTQIIKAELIGSENKEQEQY